MAAVESPARRAGGWRETFLNRHRRGDASTDSRDLRDADLERDREPRVRSRSLSRPRPSAEAGSSAANAFDQKAVLDQDRALIEQLTQRQPRREGSVVRKPPPPPKVSPYRGSAGASPAGSAAGSLADGLAAAAGPTLLESAGAAIALEKPTLSDLDVGRAAAATPVTDAPTTPVSACDVPTLATQQRSTTPVAAAQAPEAIAVVPRAGDLFTAKDIDSWMDRLGGGSGEQRPQEQVAFGTSGATAVPTVDPGQCQQNFGDISKEFFRENRMQVAEVAPKEPEKKPEPEKAPEQKFKKPFVVPDRRALKEQINSIDSWLEEDFSAREQLSSQRKAPMAPGLPSATAPLASLAEVAAGLSGDTLGSAEAEVFKKLEDVKRKKTLGERVTPAFMKDLAAQAKPLLPGLGLEALVRMLRLFTSARHDDHDLYLRILGEIPVQVRGISPELLTTCLRVLRRLRLPEETYLELFSMEAMNMIRAKRKPQARGPRRPPAPAPGRSVVKPVEGNSPPTTSAGAPALKPTPPPEPRPPASTEALAPFSCAELVHIGNSLTQLGAKHPARFLEIFQEQLALAIPRMTQEECEMVTPTLAFSQLMHDPLRRAFLERCAAVDAGQALPDGSTCAAPDISQYQREAEHRRRRVKNFRNIYMIEASVRKETFSFFSSLPQEVRAYLDKLHAAGQKLQHGGTSALASQIANVLDQLGVSCDLSRSVGSLSLHVVAKATNPRAEVAEVVYECNDFSAFYAVRQEDKGPPELTSLTKFRHKLLNRVGVQLTHINGFEWQTMSEAQRINYMVKLQSLQ